MTVYFVTSGLKEELSVIRKVRPEHLLCSYWYFRNKNLQEFCSELGYRPKIMLDSGAYSAFTKGKSVSLLDYMAYIRENEACIWRYVALDVIGDSYTTRAFYDIMRVKGYDPVPVFHYGDNEDAMDHYVTCGARLIALGNTVPIRDKSLVARWCAEMHERYPEVGLHLLGSSSQKMIDCGALASCDSSAWYMRAVVGHPRTIPGENRPSKIARAEANMIRIMEAFNDSSISVVHSGGECADGTVQPD